MLTIYLNIKIPDFLKDLFTFGQAETVKQYPEKVTVVFFFMLFGTMQCAFISSIVERTPSSWTLRPGIAMIAIIYSVRELQTLLYCLFITFCWIVGLYFVFPSILMSGSNYSYCYDLDNSCITLWIMYL